LPNVEKKTNLEGGGERSLQKDAYLNTLRGVKGGQGICKFNPQGGKEISRQWGTLVVEKRPKKYARYYTEITERNWGKVFGPGGVRRKGGALSTTPKGKER